MEGEGRFRLTFTPHTRQPGFNGSNRSTPRRPAQKRLWGGVHNTYFWIDLKKRFTAVALMQILPIGDPDVQGTMIAFERALYAAVERRGSVN